MNEILIIIEENVADSIDNIKYGQIDPVDMEAIIFPAICNIARTYGIPSEKCSNIPTHTSITNEQNIGEEDITPDHFELTVTNQTSGNLSNHILYIQTLHISAKKGDTIVKTYKGFITIKAYNT